MDVEEDAAPAWPTCDAKPANVPLKTIPEIWADNASVATQVWVPGAYITAISKGACVAGSRCQIFLQADETYPSFSAGAKHGIRLVVSSTVADKFVGLAVGDKVDVLGHAWRNNQNPPQNELLLDVNKGLPGCAKKVGTGNPQPISGVKLSDLTHDAFENTHGPLLVKVDAVSGKPGPANEIFALWNTAGPFVDSGLETVVNASPYFLPDGKFTGLPTDTLTTVKFASISGVFAVYVWSTDAGVGPKYLVLYSRQNTELVKLTP